MPHTLRTDRLLLRPLGLRDARALSAVFTSPVMTAPTKTWPFPVTAEHARFRIRGFMRDQGRDAYGFGILLGARLIGNCGGAFGYGGRWRIGYSISEDVWGQGYGTEAVRALCAFGFRALRIRRIEADVFKDNPGSIGVLEKIGFRRIGDVGPGWSTTRQASFPRWGYAMTREGFNAP